MSFFSKIFHSPIFRIAAPLALSFLAPGLGTALGSAILGEGAVGASTLGGGLLGAGIGAATGGGLKGAALGAVGGGLAPNLGDIASGVGNFAENNIPGVSGLANGISSLSNDVGSGLSSAGNAVSSTLGLGGSSSSSGGLSSDININPGPIAARAPNSLFNLGGSSGGASSLAGGGSMGGGSTFGSGGFNIGSSIASALGGANQNSAIKKAQQQLLAANSAQQANLNTFDPSGITSDPGYKFNLDQGNQGIQRQLAASGLSQSGAALKAATKFNQDYATNSFNNYYQRWLDKTGAQNQLLGQGGNINAQGTVGQANNLSSALSGVLNPSSGVSAQSLLALLQKQQNPFG